MTSSICQRPTDHDDKLPEKARAQFHVFTTQEDVSGFPLVFRDKKLQTKESFPVAGGRAARRTIAARSREFTTRQHSIMDSESDFEAKGEKKIWDRESNPHLAISVS